MQESVQRVRINIGLGIFLAGVAVAAAILISDRTSIVATPYGYIESDQWTGRKFACSVANPWSYAEKLKQNSVAQRPNPDYVPRSAAQQLDALDHDKEAPPQYLYSPVSPSVARERTGAPSVCVDLN